MITNTADFVATLILYSQRRDKGLGFNSPSRRTLGLAWYYRRLTHDQTSRYIQGLLLKQKLEANQEAVTTITQAAAEISQPEERRIILGKLLAIQAEQEQISRRLTELANG